MIETLELETNNGKVIFFDNRYGDFGIMLKGPKGGFLADDLISLEQVRQLKEFIEAYLDVEDFEAKP